MYLCEVLVVSTLCPIVDCRHLFVQSRPLQTEDKDIFLHDRLASLIDAAAINQVNSRHCCWIACESQVALHRCVVVPEVKCTADGHKSGVVKS